MKMRDGEIIPDGHYLFQPGQSIFGYLPETI